MKNLARFGAVLYCLAVFFVVFHNAGLQFHRLLETRFLVMLLLGGLGFIVILKVIQEETVDEDGEDELN
jgi:hypothetical protein